MSWDGGSHYAQLGLQPASHGCCGPATMTPLPPSLKLPPPPQLTAAAARLHTRGDEGALRLLHRCVKAEAAVDLWGERQVQRVGRVEEMSRPQAAVCARDGPSSQGGHRRP